MICYIYMIFCKNYFEEDGCESYYIGHSKNMKMRKELHKSCSKNPNSEKYPYPIYKIIRENGGWDNWYVIELEEFECFSEKEASIKENEYIKIFEPDMNDRKAYISSEELKNLHKHYEKINKEKRKIQKAKYYIENKEHKNEQFYCDCGGKFTFSHKARHLKTKKHIAWQNSLSICQ